jgi:uroporphyrinogen-III decarboxylase
MLGNIVAAPPVRAALDSLVNLAEATSAHNAALGAHIQEMAELGYPFGWVAIAVPPFDLVSDFFRGLKGGSLDLFRQPDKLLAAVDLMEPATIAGTIQAAKMSGNPRVFIAMHRGADNFMSDADFRKYYWPSFKRQIEAFVAAGLTPMPLFEGGYSSRLKYLAELPAGKVAAHFDVVDRRKFKEICGDVLCFWGNIPSSILCTGTPQQVKDEVKELVDVFGDTGALMIDGTVGIPDEARPENLYALREAVDEYGRL